jgi:hypothetical protein
VLHITTHKTKQLFPVMYSTFFFHNTGIALSIKEPAEGESTRIRLPAVAKLFLSIKALVPIQPPIQCLTGDKAAGEWDWQLTSNGELNFAAIYLHQVFIASGLGAVGTLPFDKIQGMQRTFRVFVYKSDICKLSLFTISLILASRMAICPILYYSHSVPVSFHSQVLMSAREL